MKALIAALLAGVLLALSGAAAFAGLEGGDSSVNGDHDGKAVGHNK